MMDARTSLCLSLLPLDIRYADWNANLGTARRLLSEMPDGIDIVVLPELFSTGFMRHRDKAWPIALEAWPVAVDMLHEQASARDCAIAGSMMYADAATGVMYNRAFFVEPQGRMWHYDKRHLFTLGAEADVFAGGDRPSPLISFRGWNIALAVCYDIRFPAWVRNCGLKYDLLLVPANWPEARSFAWTHLLQARAIENQAFVAGANRSGCDKMGCYDGQSHVCDFGGRFVGLKQHGIRLDSVISKAEMDAFRMEFPFWRDADDVSIVR